VASKAINDAFVKNQAMRLMSFLIKKVGVSVILVWLMADG
jgi:hypothetical protein